MVLERSQGLVFNAARTHLLVSDAFRPIALSLADGTRSMEGTPLGSLSAVAGVRYVTPAYRVDAEGRNDLAGATEVLAIGTDTPLARIAWIVPRDAGGYTQAIGVASERSERVFLLERAMRFGGADVGVWLRVIDRTGAVAERRFDLSGALPTLPPSYDAPMSLLVDEPGDAVFVITGERSDGAPSVTRVDLATGARVSLVLELGAPAPALGTAHVGEPPSTLLDAALSPDGSVLVVSTRDGRLRTYDATVLEEIRPPMRVGVQVANGDTYLPSLRSPVAFSPGGRYLAVLDEAGDIQVLDSETRIPLVTLPTAAPAIEPGLDDLQPTREMTMRFVADGLVVVSDGGVERFICGS